MKYARLIVLVLCLIGISRSTFAQEKKVYNIGLVMWVGNDAFIDEMTSLGYVQGENINYSIPNFEGVAQEDFMNSYNTQIKAMVDAKVDVFVSNTDTDAMNLQSLTGDIPVVFARSDDPVATGAVADLITPGGHMTGIMTNRPHERRLQILTEINPDTKKIYYLYSPLTLEAETVLHQVEAVAKDLNVEVVPAPTPDLDTGLKALADTPEGINWLFLTPYVPFDTAFYNGVIELSTSRQMPIAAVTDFPIKGYQVGYGPNLDETARQAARMVDSILRGANPGDLSVQTAENFLLINLEAFDAIDMKAPAAILRQANLIVRPGYFDNQPATGGS